MNSRATFLIPLILAACSDPSAISRPDEDGRVLGAIEFYGDTARVTIPSEAAVGEEFDVTVVTYGGGCVAEGETEVETDGSAAVVTAYDYDSSVMLPPNVVCTAILKVFEHVATLQFDQPGTATVIVVGQSRPSHEVITVRRMVEIR